MGAAGKRVGGAGISSDLIGTPIWRPYRPLRPLPSSSLMHWSALRPASRQRPQGRWRSQPFLLFRHRWQRGLVDRSGCSSSPGWPDIAEAIEGLRDWLGREAGDIGPAATLFDFFSFVGPILGALVVLGLVALVPGARGFPRFRVFAFVSLSCSPWPLSSAPSSKSASSPLASMLSRGGTKWLSVVGWIL